MLDLSESILSFGSEVARSPNARGGRGLHALFWAEDAAKASPQCLCYVLVAISELSSSIGRSSLLDEFESEYE